MKPYRPFRSRMHWRCGVALLSLALVSGCGGGSGGVSSAPSPTPSPTPTPAPSPTPTPAAVFDTSEYRFSDGPAYHNAIPAWQLGATGAGVTIGIVDSGIDETNPEFAGRISPDSADVAGNNRTGDESGHGTMVALVAAAARDDYGVLGIAWGATVMSLRADAPGSCATANSSDPDSGCAFYETDIAAGIDQAVTHGAKVINISLGGGGGAGVQLRDAIARAASAGVVVVVAAGNIPENPEPGYDSANPDPFAVSLRQAGNGNVIIAGSVDSSGTISSFSHRAGSEATSYLAALGEDVCCVYENGELLTVEQNGTTYAYVMSGTSFSAPQISGAAALLFQAFPNLTANEVVELLLSTARDAGTTGTDAVYGQGILDIGAAFEPQGATTLVGGTQPVALTDSSVVTSSAMGDAGGGAALQAIVLDSYRRAYEVNLAQGLRRAQVSPRLASALTSPLRQIAGGSDRLSLAFSVDAQSKAAALPWSGQLRLRAEDAQAARVLAGRVMAQLAPDTRMAFGYAQGADGLMAQVQGAEGPAFLVAGSPLDDLGFSRNDEMAFAFRRQWGALGLTVSGERGDAVSGAPLERSSGPERQWRQSAYTRLGLSFDRSHGDLDTSLSVSWLAEDRTVLGAWLHDALGPGGADSLFLDARTGWGFAPGWRLGAAWRQGYTYARQSGMVAAGSHLASNAWAVDVARFSLFKPGDSLALRLSQPLRVSSGGLNFDLPVAYSYDTLSATQGIRRLPLSPQGREVTAELAWRGPLWGGSASASLFYRRDPGNYAALPDDKGLGLSWNTEF